MIQLKDIKLPINHSSDDLYKKIKQLLKLDSFSLQGRQVDFSYTIYRQSIDARKKPDIYYIYSLGLDFYDSEKKVKDYLIKKKIKNVSFEAKEEYKIPDNGNERLDYRPVIIGAGPAGLFAAYILCQKGFKPIIIERGDKVEYRIKKVEDTFNNNCLDTESNVQFGEGGAGTFSDGKLNTLTKDTNGRNSYVLNTFAKFGAAKEITYVAKPHIGTDKLTGVVRSMREYIIKQGGQVIFNTKLVSVTSKDKDLLELQLFNNISKKESTILTNVVILCIGHSARDTFEMLYKMGINMEQKSFAVGFRLSHPQSYVDRWQYGVDDAATIGLGAADYKVTNECSNGRRVYSFCMCPGGYVVNASSEEGQICVNGMSESKRDSGFANSAIICGINPDDFIQDKVPADHPLSGMYYQRSIEREAFQRTNGKIGLQYFGDFIDNCASKTIDKNDICIKGQYEPANLRGIFSKEIDLAIIESIQKFGYTRKAFDDKKAVLYGVEARTSSPIRINRDENFESNIKGIYPCGEGAGYAGGITSAAADGIKVAEAIIRKYSPSGL